MKDLFLLDLSWHLYRNSYTFKNFSVIIEGFQRPTGHIYGVLRTISQLKRSYPKSQIYLCVDGYPDVRHGENAEYKANREKSGFNIMSDIPAIVVLAKALGAETLYHPKLESDDIMFAMAKEFAKDQDNQVYIYSGDDDLLQSIQDNICVVRSLERGKVVKIDRDFVVNDSRMAEKFHGVEPQDLPKYRCLVGDHSDNLKGIPRFNREVAKTLATRFQTLDDILSFEPKTQTGLKTKALLTQYEDLIRSNYAIMKLRMKEELKAQGYEIHQVKFTSIDKTVAALVSLFQLRSMQRYVKVDFRSSSVYVYKMLCSSWRNMFYGCGD